MASKSRDIFSFQILLILLLVSKVLSAKLKLEPVYDSGHGQFKLFKIGAPLTLQCKPKSSSDGEKIYWMKENRKITDINIEGGHFKTIPSDGSLVIEKTKEWDAGNYSCAIENSPLESYVFEVWANVVVKVPKELQVKEGDRMELSCIVKGTEAEVTWKFRPELEKKDDKTNDNQKEIIDDDAKAEYTDIENNDRFILLENGDKVPNSLLVIRDIKMSDRGFYKCTGTNDKMKSFAADDETFADSESYIRIKDRTAAFYPAIGIVAQIVVLAIIIIISENRRNQNEVDESDTDESPEKKEDSNFIRRGH